MQERLEAGIRGVFPELTDDVIDRMRNVARGRVVMEILIRQRSSRDPVPCLLKDRGQAATSSSG